MASVNQKFVLVGPNAGKSIAINGHEFVDGEMTFQGSADQASTLERVFGYYGVMTAEKAELHALKAGQEPAHARKALDEALAKLPDGNTDADYVVRAMGAHFGELFTSADEAKVRELVKPQANQDASGNGAGMQGNAAGTSATDTAQDSPNGAPGGKPSLAEAIGQLDPENDAHWTSNNLPSLDHLGELVGKKVARGDVDAVADGYTRAKARAAKQ